MCEKTPDIYLVCEKRPNIVTINNNNTSVTDNTDKQQQEQQQQPSTQDIKPSSHHERVQGTRTLNPKP